MADLGKELAEKARQARQAAQQEEAAVKSWWATHWHQVAIGAGLLLAGIALGKWVI